MTGSRHAGGLYNAARGASLACSCSGARSALEKIAAPAEGALDETGEEAHSSATSSPRYRCCRHHHQPHLPASKGSPGRRPRPAALLPVSRVAEALVTSREDELLDRRRHVRRPACRRVGEPCCLNIRKALIKGLLSPVDDAEGRAARELDEQYRCPCAARDGGGLGGRC